MLAEIQKELRGLEVTPKKLRDFGLLFCGVFALIAGAVFWKGNPGWTWFLAGSAGFLLAGMLIPSALGLFYRVWMGLASVMGWFMTRVILAAAFTLIMMPIGLMLRLAGRDLLDQKIDRGSVTYWKRHEHPEQEDYTRQF